MSIQKKSALKVTLAIATLFAVSSSFAQDYTASCSTAGFTGTAYINAEREGPRVYVTNTAYQIKAPAGHQNAHAAKLSVYEVDGYFNKPTPWRSYSKNLRQDNLKHAMKMRTYLWTPSSVTQYVKFEFDRSQNSKPTCTASVKILLPG